MDNNTKIKRNPDLIAVDMNGETVMMNIDSGDYFGIDSVGAYIWQLIEKEHTVDSIIESVSSHFNNPDKNDIESDIFTFLLDLKKENLLA